jgi:hypothetical protein
LILLIHDWLQLDWTFRVIASLFFISLAVVTVIGFIAFRPFVLIWAEWYAIVLTLAILDSILAESLPPPSFRWYAATIVVSLVLLYLLAVIVI